MHLLNMFSLKTINKIVQSDNIVHPLTLRICPFECFQWVYSIIKCSVDIDNLLTLPVVIFVYKLFIYKCHVIW